MCVTFREGATNWSRKFRVCFWLDGCAWRPISGWRHVCLSVWQTVTHPQNHSCCCIQIFLENCWHRWRNTGNVNTLLLFCRSWSDNRGCWPIWWRHQMETFSVLLALCAGIGEFPSQSPMTRNFDVFFDLHQNKRGWVSKRYIGDLRRHHAHYDVTVMK